MTCTRCSRIHEEEQECDDDSGCVPALPGGVGGVETMKRIILIAAAAVAAVAYAVGVGAMVGLELR